MSKHSIDSHEEPGSSKAQQVMDGSDITELVQNEKVFGEFVGHKFQQLDADCDGMLSLKELQPAVDDIGAALGLPAQGTSPDSDHIYAEMLDEFTDGKKGKISETKFKEVLSDFLLGMAAGLKRDPVVILRMDGEDLGKFVKSSSFEPEMVSIYFEINTQDGSLRDYVMMAFEKLTVDQGMPPANDPWVVSKILEPAIESLGGALKEPVSQDAFLVEFKKAAENVVQLLKEQPAIVAHSQNTFDGSGIKRLLSNKFELGKTLDSALKSVPKDRHGKISKAYLGFAFDTLAASAVLPPLGAVDQMDNIVNGALKMFDAGDGKSVKKDEFKKLLTEVLGSIMMQLEGKPILVSVNSVVHEPVASSSTLLQSP